MILGTGNLTKSITGAFFLQYGRDILEKVFIIEIRQEKENLDVWPLSVENEALLTCNFTS